MKNLVIPEPLIQMAIDVLCMATHPNARYQEITNIINQLRNSISLDDYLLQNKTEE